MTGMSQVQLIMYEQADGPTRCARLTLTVSSHATRPQPNHETTPTSNDATTPTGIMLNGD
jgi:hypothetical protein